MDGFIAIKKEAKGAAKKKRALNSAQLLTFKGCQHADISLLLDHRNQEVESEPQRRRRNEKRIRLVIAPEGVYVGSIF